MKKTYEVERGDNINSTRKHHLMFSPYHMQASKALEIFRVSLAFSMPSIGCHTKSCPSPASSLIMQNASILLKINTRFLLRSGRLRKAGMSCVSCSCPGVVMGKVYARNLGSEKLVERYNCQLWLRWPIEVR